MSDEQLQALGLPRREFLKKAAIGAGVFMAPVIVSFGLGGTAEAAPGCVNQSFANQFAAPMSTLAILVWTREQQNLVDHDFASDLRARLLDAEGKLLDGNVKRTCRMLDDLYNLLVAQSGRKIDAGIASSFSNTITNWQTQMGCASCT